MSCTWAADHHLHVIAVLPTGGWSHLQQLFGLIKGSHTLLSAQKVPSSTSHLILRLLQQVAAAAAANRIRLDIPCAVPGSQASQEPSQLPSQKDPSGHSCTTYLSVMLDVSEQPPLLLLAQPAVALLLLLHLNKPNKWAQCGCVGKVFACLMLTTCTIAEICGVHC
jgi:hypothetical protein